MSEWQQGLEDVCDLFNGGPLVSANIGETRYALISVTYVTHNADAWIDLIANVTEHRLAMVEVEMDDTTFIVVSTEWLDDDDIEQVLTQYVGEDSVVGPDDVVVVSRFGRQKKEPELYGPGWIPVERSRLTQTSYLPIPGGALWRTITLDGGRPFAVNTVFVPDTGI